MRRSMGVYANILFFLAHASMTIRIINTPLLSPSPSPCNHHRHHHHDEHHHHHHRHHHHTTTTATIIMMTHSFVSASSACLSKRAETVSASPASAAVTSSFRNFDFAKRSRCGAGRDANSILFHYGGMLILMPMFCIM